MGMISMEFTRFLEMTKGTDYELFCEIFDTDFYEEVELYDFYVIDRDGRKTFLIRTDDFTYVFQKYFELYFRFIKGTLEIYEKSLEEMREKLYGKIC